LIASLTDAAFQQITNAELAANLGGRFVGGVQSSDRGVGRNVDNLQLGKLGGDFVGHAFGE
jgi:hypothetical protein